MKFTFVCIVFKNMVKIHGMRTHSKLSDLSTLFVDKMHRTQLGCLKTDFFPKILE
jgi:hypothetical protein